MISTYACNPWHYVACGPKVPAIVNAVIEIPSGSRSKYELHKESGMLKLDRVLFSAVHYPMNYGFIPQTYCEDNDPLDILVLCSVSIEPMTLVEAKVIGVMRMIDGGQKDDKIIAVAVNDQSVNHINQLQELPPHYMRQIKNFFQDYKKLEKKVVIVEKFQSRDAAYATVQQSVELYKQKFQQVHDKVQTLNSTIKLIPRKGSQ